MGGAALARTGGPTAPRGQWVPPGDVPAGPGPLEVPEPGPEQPPVEPIPEEPGPVPEIPEPVPEGASSLRAVGGPGDGTPAPRSGRGAA